MSSPQCWAGTANCCTASKVGRKASGQMSAESALLAWVGLQVVWGLLVAALGVSQARQVTGVLAGVGVWLTTPS